VGTIRINVIPGQAGSTLRAGTRRGVTLATEHLLGASRARVPIEEATLERSGKTSQEDTTRGVIGAVSYDTPYAARQHEELTYRHDPGRTAKYLEGPLLEEAATMAGLIAKAVEGRLR
jgi:hypothetical protein